MDISEQIYETLQNTLESEYCGPWVQPVFIPGHPCFEAYCNMMKAYERLRIRLGEADDDTDVEEIINNLLAYGKLVAMEMFLCGIQYQKMQNEKSPGA